MIRITVATKGKDPRTMINHLEQTKSSIKTGLFEIGQKTAQRMKEIIDENRKRTPSPNKASKRHLADVIEAEITPFGVGVGNISKLNAETRYWEVVNNGGYIPPSMLGTYGAGKERPNPQLRGVGVDYFSPIRMGGRAPSPLRPMHYIELTDDWLNIYWNLFWSTYL